MDTEFTRWLEFWETQEDGPTPVMRWVICDRCEGEGHHGPGWSWTASEFDEQFGPDGEEFMEEMRRGTYDVPCRDCGGSGKTREIDQEASPEAYASWEAWLESAAETAAIYAMETRMGA